MLLEVALKVMLLKVALEFILLEATLLLILKVVLKIALVLGRPCFQPAQSSQIIQYSSMNMTA